MMAMSYVALLEHLTVEFIFAINYVCSLVCLTLTMHRYIRFLIDHYTPLVHAKHLARLDMMRRSENVAFGVRFRELPCSAKKWSYRNWNFSFAAHQSARKTMEDRMAWNHEPTKHNMSIFSIFDGHGGTFVSNYLEQNFNKRILRMLEKKEKRCGEKIYDDSKLIEQSISDEVERIDADISTSYTGSTLISALVDHNHFLTVVNVGDSRCVGCDASGNLVSLSTDHKPDLPEERERIEKAGGFVEFYGVERVQGILAVSRAFGDTAFKRWVIVRPEVVRLDLRESPLRYVVLASDGFWDVVKSYEAVLEVNYLLDRGQTDIADHLVQLALKRKSADNISVFFSMEESQRSYSMDSWNQTIFTAESQISVSRLNRVTYGYITPLIISFGVVGDVLTVATLTHPLLRRAGIIYTYLTLLAMTDLFTHISVIPMVLWILDVRLCSKSSAFYYAHIGFPLSNALMSASVWIVVFLTFSQYMAVCQPFHRGFLRKRRLCFWLFAFAYIFSFCIYAPWATKKSVHHIPAGLLTCPYVICDRKIETFFFAYEWVREFFTRVFPFILIAYMNTKILLTYKNTKKDRQKRLAHSTKTQQSEQEERRLFFLLFAIIIVFFLCTIPAAPLTIFVADDRSQNWTFQFIRACVNLLEFTKFALNFYFYCLINPDIRRICIHMIQCQKFGKLPRVKGQPVNPISVYTRSTKSTIRGFASANDEFSRRNSQRHIDDDYRKSIDVKVHRSASLLSQYYCETPSEFDHLTIIRESEDSLIDATERERLPSYASAAPSPAPPRTSDGCFLALPR